MGEIKCDNAGKYLIRVGQGLSCTYEMFKVHNYIDIDNIVSYGNEGDHNNNKRDYDSDFNSNIKNYYNNDRYFYSDNIKKKLININTNNSNTTIINNNNIIDSNSNNYWCSEINGIVNNKNNTNIVNKSDNLIKYFWADGIGRKTKHTADRIVKHLNINTMSFR